MKKIMKDAVIKFSEHFITGTKMTYDFLSEPHHKAMFLVLGVIVLLFVVAK